MGNLKALLKKSKTASPQKNKLKKCVQYAPGSEERQRVATLFAEGRIAEVMEIVRELTLRFPKDGFGWKVLGVIYNQQEKTTEAIAAMKRAVALSPNDAEAYSNLGPLLQDIGRYEEAAQVCKQAIRLQPDFAPAHKHLGDALRDIGHYDKAVASFERALQLKPDFPEALNNLGALMLTLGNPVGAIKNYQRALEISPAFAEARNNLGSALQRIGRRAESIVEFRQALVNKLDFPKAHSNLLFGLSHDETVNAQTLFSEHRRFGLQREIHLHTLWPDHANTRNPDRILRVGFVSADLKNHAVATWLEPALFHLSKSPNFFLKAYSNRTEEDDVTQRLKQYFASWQRVINLTDAVLAQTIQDDGIDILIDLSGHTDNNRLPVFARKPAPIQISWIGYPGTTGLKAMDYYLTDRNFLPPGQFDSQFTEKLVYLSATASFAPFENAPPVSSLPALQNGYITFGSFNRSDKINMSVIALWSQILQAMPHTRMILGGLSNTADNEKLLAIFEQNGIGQERLQLYGKCSMDKYLALHHQIDFCLDTFPYNGSTTTCHALWMGVPVLTLPGDTVPSRASAWALQHVGLDSFVARDRADYVAKGIAWARKQPELAQIRHELRDRMCRACLCQPAAVAKSLENALRIMWFRWCTGLPVESFEVGQ